MRSRYLPPVMPELRWGGSAATKQPSFKNMKMNPHDFTGWLQCLTAAVQASCSAADVARLTCVACASRWLLTENGNGVIATEV